MTRASAETAAAPELARAKVNLALHVTGRRADGYHLLDTLVAFPDIGDRLFAEAADDLSLAVTGPFAGSLSADDDDNLVLQAARRLRERLARPIGARLTLEKNLPVASGIGGGSADAAAVLRLLTRLWSVGIAETDLAGIALSLGADVPMCLASRALAARGIGEDIALLPELPQVGIVLVNPGVEVATPAVFKALERRDNPPLPPLPDGFGDPAALCDWLAATRNDLEAPAVAIAPVIAEVLAALRACPGTLLARMSGSGATCFALHDSVDAAKAAAGRLGDAHRAWWIRAASLP